MLGVVMDSVKLCGGGTDQIADRQRLEEVTVPRKSIADFFKSPTKGLTHKNIEVCQSKTTPRDQPKKSINSAETKSKKRKRISDVDLNDSLSDFDSKEQKASKKKAKSTDKARNKKLSATLTCSPNGSHSGKENEELPVEKNTQEASRQPDKCEGNSGNQPSRKHKPSKLSKSKALKAETDTNDQTQDNTKTQATSKGNKQTSEKEQSKITKGSDGQMTVEVSYEEFLQSEGVSISTCEAANQNDEDQTPQLTVPKCHKLFDYFKKKPVNSTVDLTGSADTDVYVTKADVHFEPSPPHNNNDTCDLKQSSDRDERRTSNILISDEECDLNILEISSEIILVSPPQGVEPCVKESTSVKDLEVNTSQKTTQATLCFTKAGLTANKSNKKNNAHTVYPIQDTPSPVKPCKTKGKKGQSSQKVNKTVKDKSKGKAEIAINDKSPKVSCEDVVPDSSLPSRRSSPRIQSHTKTIETKPEVKNAKLKLSKKLRQRYKVSRLEAGGDNRSPIRIRLKRCSKSSGDEGSCDVFSPEVKKVKKSVLKAQKLLEKAKKSKPIKNVIEGQCKKKINPKSLVGNVKAVRKASNKALIKPTKALIKPTKAKVTGKLAPIFSKEKVLKTKSKPNVPLDVLCQKVEDRKASPVKLKQSPVKRQYSPVKRPRPPTSDVQVAKYPPISANTHVQQADTDGEGVSVWDLQPVTLNLKKVLVQMPVAGSWTDYKHKKTVKVEQIRQSFRRPDGLDEDVIEHLLTEVQKNNPNFPVQRLYKLLKGKKDGDCKEGCVEESSNTVPTDNNVTPKEIVLLDSPTINNSKAVGVVSPEEAGMTGRTKRLRRKRGSKTPVESKTAEENNKATEASQSANDLPQTSEPKKQVTVSDRLWSDKYQPSESLEIVGNGGCVRKLKLWLQKWKERSDKEARLLKKLLRKQHKELAKEGSKENSSDWWTDDESDFEASKDSDWMEAEDSLINTILITGPHGVGKSSTVYALAQELEFQVLEVNTSSCRSGKKILNKLQEATQSHRVSKQNLERLTSVVITPSKSQPTTNKTVITSPAPTKLPTAFTNLFKKAKETTEPVITIDSEEKKPKKGAGTKRKRALSKEKDCQSPKKKVKPDTVTKVPTPAVMVEESNNSSTLPTKSLNLASNSLILFDEVDLVFEEDKGFWGAIQSFMNTSKRPIILTTSERSFSEKFEGRFDQLPFRTPHCVNVVTYLQLVCLVENVRTDFLELINLVQLLKGDVRRSLQCLQWWVESGGGCQQTLTSVLPSDEPGEKSSLYFIEDTLSQSQDSNMGDTPLADRSRYMDQSVDFKQARLSRRRIICDDSSLDSCPSPQKNKQTLLKSIPEVDITDENAMFPFTPAITGTVSALVHQMCVESISGCTSYTSHHFRDLFTKQNCDIAVSVIQLLQSHNLNILRSNSELFLPLPICEVDQDNWPIKSAMEASLNNNTQSRVRIKTSSWASDSSDSEWLFDKKIKTQTESKDTDVFDNVKEEESDTMSVEMKQCLHKSLRSMSDFYENSSYLDILQSRFSCSTERYHDVPSLNRCTVLPGSSDDFHTVVRGSGTEMSREITAEISVRSLRQCYQTLEAVHHTAQCDPVFIDNQLTIPVLKGYHQFRLSQDIPIRQSSLTSRKKVFDDVIRSLPLHTWSSTRNTSLDYIPTLRSICHAEQCRQIAKTKRRFLHYLDGISLPLRESTMKTLGSSL